MDWGMANRMSQLIQPDGHCVFMPIDHGYFLGPTSKLEEPGKTVEPLMPYADALFVTRGVLRSAIDPANTKPIVLRVSGGTSTVAFVILPRLSSVDRGMPWRVKSAGEKVFLLSDLKVGTYCCSSIHPESITESM